MTIGDYARILIARNQPALVHGWQVNGVGWATTTLGGTAYIGGEFSAARAHDGSSSLPRRNLVAVSTATGQPTGFRADTNGRVRSLATDGARLYVAGSFTSINGVARNHLAALDLQTGAVLPGWVHNTDNDVYALSVGGGRLYAVGNFSQIDGAARQRVASIDLATSHLNGFVANAAGGGVNAVAATADGSRVYLGGVYSSVNGTPTTALTALNSSGGVVPVPFAGVRGSALDLEVGAFGVLFAAFGDDANEAVAFNPVTGARLWGFACVGDAQAIHAIGSKVFSGFHQSCAGDPTAHLITTDFGGHLQGFKPVFDGFWGVRDLAGDSSALVITGDFTTIDGQAAQGFAIFRPSP